MKFREKASALVLCAVLLGSSIIPVSAANKDEIVGANRYDTAAKIADRMGNYDTAILVNSDKSLADGLSASSLAGKENAPILLVKQNSIPDVTMARLENVSKVYIIGGTAAISKNVENQLYGKEVQRISGKDRLDTSRQIADLIGEYKEAFIVNGFRGEADAMSVASVAARDKAPILLTNGEYADYPIKGDVDYYSIGGDVVVSEFLSAQYGARRLAGLNRYETNRKVIETFYPTSEKLYYTKGNPLVDALTVSSLAKNDGVVFVSPNSDNSILKVDNIIQVGGINFNVDISGNSKPVIYCDREVATTNISEEINLLELFGIHAIDKEDGDLTDKITMKEELIITQPGSYNIELIVTDSNGGEFTKEIVLLVEEVGNTDVNSEAFQAEFREEVYKLVNDYRISKGVNSLTPHYLQERATLEKTKHLGELNYFAHEYDDSQTQYYKDKWKDGDSSLMIDEIYPELFENTGFEYGYENLYYCGWTSATPKSFAQSVFNSWKNSPLHEAAMTHPNAVRVGISLHSANGKTYIAGAFEH